MYRNLCVTHGVTRSYTFKVVIQFQKCKKITVKKKKGCLLKLQKSVYTLKPDVLKVTTRKPVSVSHPKESKTCGKASI